VREFLEKNWTEALSEADAVRLAVKSLLEVVDSGSKNMEVAVLRRNEPVVMMLEEELAAIIVDIEREIEEAKQKSGQDAAMAP
jgi:20S proteasome subunit alpha 4